VQNAWHWLVRVHVAPKGNGGAQAPPLTPLHQVPAGQLVSPAKLFPPQPVKHVVASLHSTFPGHGADVALQVPAPSQVPLLASMPFEQVLPHAVPLGA
jgi:hypothetical protein